jgi:hypothetical protein
LLVSLTPYKSLSAKILPIPSDIIAKALLAALTHYKNLSNACQYGKNENIPEVANFELQDLELPTCGTDF